MDDEGYNCKFEDCHCKLKLGSQIAIVGHRDFALCKYRFKIVKRSKRRWMPVKDTDGKCRGVIKPTTMIAKFDQSNQDPSI